MTYSHLFLFFFVQKVFWSLLYLYREVRPYTFSMKSFINISVIFSCIL